MVPKSIYGQFCPIARAAEILAERWTPLVVRELICGSTRFNDLQRGLPRMSSSLLSRRLKQLEDAGILTRESEEDARGAEYHLTEAGNALFPILMQMGEWAQRWVRDDLTVHENLDPILLMWDIRRNVTGQGMPDGQRFVVQFYFVNMPHNKRSYWLVFERGEVDLCYRDPGYFVDMQVRSDVLTLVEIWLGHTEIGHAIAAGRLVVDGSPPDEIAFRSWFTGGPFAPAGREAPGLRTANG